MEDIRIQMLIGKLMIPGQYLSSIIDHGSPLFARPCCRLPTVTTPWVHHTSVLDSPVPRHLSTDSQGYSLPSVYNPPQTMSRLARQISEPH